MKLVRFFSYWIPLAISLTLLSGIIYLVAQQSMRQGANEQQVQIAEDLATAFSNGQQAQSVILGSPVDLKKSISPFIIIYTAGATPIASSARLQGKTPSLPIDVFSYVKQHGEDRFTWQPEPGVRAAVVVTYFTGTNTGYVLAGRSLREVEKREDAVLHIVIVGWFISLFVTFMVTSFFFTFKEKKAKH